MNTDRRQFGVPLLIILAGACASILMFWITDYGPGVSPDSTTYIETARNLLAGNGFTVGGKPMTHYPPAYPLLLSIVGLFQHGDILQAGRLLGALLFGANLVLFGLAVQMCTARSLSATTCAILFFLCSAPIIVIHSMVWSEALFITFSLAAFVLLSLHVIRPTLYLLLIAALMAGFAITTRFVGVTLLPPMAFALLLFGDRPMKYKIRDTILSTTVASLPLAFWLIRNVEMAQTATNRTFAIHPFAFHHAKSLINTMHDFALPIPISGWTKALILCVATALFLVALILLRRKNYISRNVTSARIILPVLCILFFLTYVACLMISISFFDAYTPLNTRIMLPAFLVLTVAGISLAWSLSRALDKSFLWYSFVFFAFLSISLNGYRAISQAIDIHKNGRGYTSRYWQGSEIVSYLADVRDGRQIYSNGPDVIRFLTEKEAIMIPNKVFADTRKVNEDYEDQLNRMFVECREGKVLVAYLNGVTWRWYLPSIEDLESEGNLPVLRRFEDGVVYARYPRTAAEQSPALDGDSVVLHPRQ